MSFFLTLSSPLFAADSGDMFGNAGAGPANSADMFDNAGIGPAHRPSVPSDVYRGPDMFPPAPVFIEPRADMFGRARPSYDFGREDMLAAHPEPVPPYPLFDYPKR